MHGLRPTRQTQTENGYTTGTACAIRMERGGPGLQKRWHTYERSLVQNFFAEKPALPEITVSYCFHRVSFSFATEGFRLFCPWLASFSHFFQRNI